MIVRPMWRWSLVLALLATLGAGGAMAAPRDAIPEESWKSSSGPVDWGFGPGVRPGSLRQKLHELAESLLGEDGIGGSDAHLTGAWGVPFSWPIVAIHTVLLPDGRVMSFGSTLNGKVGASLHYDLWNPALGAGSDAHLVLPNTTQTDIFCGGQTVLPGSGEVAIFGGDARVDGKPYFSNNRLTVFRPESNTIVSRGPMFLKRWYATALTLADGRTLVLGGRRDKPGQPPAATPEILSGEAGWTLLTGATHAAAFGTVDLNWFYPRAFVTPLGDVALIGHDGGLFTVDPAGLGTTRQLTTRIARGHWALPSVMHAPGEILSLRRGRRAVIVDVNGETPEVTPIGNVPTMRFHASATVLPSGEVLVTGGTTTGNDLAKARYEALLWNPASRTWRAGASAQKARLYHSTALLLPDATVLVAGGGAYGPVTNLNAEIYYPPYLFKSDGSGELAPRPTIVSAPQTLGEDGLVRIEVGADERIARVVAVRQGSSTHSFNADQRHLELAFVQDETQLQVTLPEDRRVALPGYYLLFVIDEAGVPSLGRTILVPVATGV